MKAIATVGERLQLIKDWQLSGLTLSEWCRRNGIHKNTFSNWIHRFRKQGLLETPAVIPETITRDPVSQDIVKIEVARNSGSVSNGIISEAAAIIPESPFSGNKGAVITILGCTGVVERITVNSDISAEIKHGQGAEQFQEDRICRFPIRKIVTEYL